VPLPPTHMSGLESPVFILILHVFHVLWTVEGSFNYHGLLTVQGQLLLGHCLVIACKNSKFTMQAEIMEWDGGGGGCA